MISNERQLKITKKRLEQFNESLNILKNDTEKDALLKELQLNALESSIEEFKEDIEEYEALKNGNISAFTIDNMDDLPTVLIKGRISKGFTQKQLAEKLSMKEQQIQRYESNLYSGISMQQMSNIMKVLEIKNTPQTFTIENPSFSLPKGFSKEKINQLTCRIHKSKTLFAFQ